MEIKSIDTQLKSASEIWRHDMKKQLFSLIFTLCFSAASLSALHVGPPSIGSAYSGKYLVPYGELKHSGKDTTYNDIILG